MTRQELLDRVTSLGGTFAKETVRLVLQDEVTDPNGLLERMRFGVFRLRAAGRPIDRRKVVRDWVLEALVSLHGAGCSPVTRREVEQQMAVIGLRYSGRAVNQGLAELVADPTSGVTTTVFGWYRLST